MLTLQYMTWWVTWCMANVCLQRVESVDDDGQKTVHAVCEKCGGRGIKLSGRSPANALRHLQVHHTTEYHEVVASTNKRKLEAVEAARTDQRKQRRVDEFFTAAQMSANHPTVIRFVREAAMFVTACGLPMSVVETEGFRRFVSAINPAIPHISRERVTKKLHELYDEAAAKLSELLRKATKVSFTTDMWTAEHTTLGYLGVTANMLLEDGPRSCLLDLRHVPGTHDAPTILTEFQDVLTCWGVPADHVASIVTDSGSNMKAAFTAQRSPGFWFPCFLHILHVVVVEAMCKSAWAVALKAKVKDIVAFFHMSSKATTAFITIQKSLGWKSILRFTQSVPTRWNSDYRMFVRFLKLREPLRLYYEGPAKKEDRFRVTDGEWLAMEILVTCLRPMFIVTEELEKGDTTVSMVLPIYWNLVTQLQPQVTDAPHPREVEFRNALLNGVRDRMGEYRGKYMVATLLDPRFVQFWGTDRDAVNEAKRMTRFLAGKDVVQEAEELAQGPAVIECTDAEVAMFGIPNPLATPRRPKNLDELEEYLVAAAEARYSPRTALTSVVTWLMSRRASFPSVFRVAAHFLSTPAGSVDSERAFSLVGDLVNQKRSRLLPENVRILSFLKANMDLLTDGAAWECSDCVECAPAPTSGEE
jgi:hypothetical protein